MFKEIKDELWAFDAEWVPDPNAGRLLYDLPDDLPDREVMDEMWKRNGATAEDPRPYLKTVLCRLVSIAMVIRIRNPSTNEVTLDLRSQPKDPTLLEDCEETAILDKFLGSIERRSPQLVGYNSSGADLPILIQRAIVNGVRAPGLLRAAKQALGGPGLLCPGQPVAHRSDERRQPSMELGPNLESDRNVVRDSRQAGV